MTTWWIWAVVAAALAIVELAGPGFFVIFFAAGAAVAAVAVALAPELALWAQVLVFAVASVLALLLFRRRLVAAFGQDKAAAGAVGELVNEHALALDDLAPGAIGKAELRGTVWKAHNGGKDPLAKGQRCVVTKVDGLTLWLKAD